jgi:hypothetical protein
LIPGPVHHFLDRPEFRTGVAIGAALTALGAAIGLLATERGRRALPLGGLLIAAGFVVGAHHSSHLPDSIAVGLALLAAAGFVTELIARHRDWLGLLGIALAAPGAVVLATHLQVAAAHAHARPRASWIAILVVASIAIGGPLVANFDRRFGARGWPMVLYAVTAVGVYATVPDTERALVLIGVSVPMLLLGWPFALFSLGSAGSYAAVGVLVWVAATDGRGRQTAIIGAIACLGLLVIEPAARLLRGRRATVLAVLPTSIWTVLPVAGAHLAIVYVASRVAGLRHAISAAATIVVIESVIVVAALFLCEPPPGAGPEKWEEAA